MFEFMVDTGKEISLMLFECLQNGFYLFLFLYPIFFIVSLIIFVFKKRG